ncbi:MAG: DUF2017 family protein [Propionibacteriaceae bacterium]
MAVWRRNDIIFIEQTLGELVSFREALWELWGRIDPDELAEPEQAPDADPFALWELSLADADVDDCGRDPIVDRLFPNPYPSDPASAAEWRRYSERDQRRLRCRELQLALDSVNSTISEIVAEREAAGCGQDLRVDLIGILQVQADMVEQWLRATNICRLAMTEELQITDAASAEALDNIDTDDPRFYDAVRYWALSELQYQILIAVDGDFGY